MLGKAIYSGLAIMILILAAEEPMTAEDNRTLFEFVKTEAAEEWQNINDGVMGGISVGEFKISENKTMEFFGTLSLENNGGFASVRSRPKNLDFRKGDTLVVRVKGDGREYSFNLYTQRRLTAFSYRAMFATEKDEWIEVRIPIDKFVATSFGQVVQGQPLNPSEVNGVGILLGDKKAGPFRLEVERIGIIRGD
jgi:monofunctional biosynthetic peptidoglycan transglycosylase